MFVILDNGLPKTQLVLCGLWINFHRLYQFLAATATDTSIRSKNRPKKPCTELSLENMLIVIVTEAHRLLMVLSPYVMLNIPYIGP